MNYKYYLGKYRYRTDLIIAALFILVFSFLVIGPLIQIIYTSFTYQSNDLRVVRDATVGEFTGYHYARVFTKRLSRSLFYKPFVNSLLVGAGVTVLAMLIGTLLAWVLVRTDVPLKRIFNAVIVIPYMMPSWVIALAWLIIFKNDRIAGEMGMFAALFGTAPPDWFAYGYVPIVICLGLHYYAYSFLLVSGALQTIDSELEEAGALAGLSKLAVLRKITFPIVLPALGSSFVLTFTRSMGTFGTPALLGLPVRFFTVPTRIYASINARNLGDGFVLALVLVVLAAVAIYINSRIVGIRKSFVTLGGKGFRSRPNKLGVWQLPVTGVILFFLFLIVFLPVLILGWGTFLLLPGDYSLSNSTTHFWMGPSDHNIASGQEGIFRNPGIWGGVWNSVRLGSARH